MSEQAELFIISELKSALNSHPLDLNMDILQDAIGEIAKLQSQNAALLDALKQLTHELIANDEEGLIGHIEIMQHCASLISEMENNHD